jgi:hypothetical protein
VSIYNIKHFPGASLRTPIQRRKKGREKEERKGWRGRGREERGGN